MRSRFSNATGKICCHSTTATELDQSILFAGSADVGTVDPPVIEPQPTASKPEKPVATRPRTRSAIKKTNITRQTKRKGAVTSEPKPVPPHQTTSIAPSNHAGGDGSGSEKSAKRANDQTDTPVQVGITSGDPSADLVSSDHVTADHLEQPPDVVGEGSTVADPPEDEPAYRMRFFLDKENGRTVIKLGYVPVDSSL